MAFIRAILRLFRTPYRTEPKRPAVMYRYPQTEEAAWLKHSRKGRK